MITKNYVTTYWNDLLDQVAPDLDRSAMLAWIQEESGGFPQALGSCYEVGIGQINCASGADGSSFGATTANLHDNFCGGFCGKTRTRDLTDDEEMLQVTTFVAMCRAYIADAQSLVTGVGASWSDADIWCMAKLKHALPVLRYLIKYAPNATSWNDFRQWAAGLDDAAVAAFGVTDTTSATKYYNLKGPNSWEWAYSNAETVGFAAGGGGGIIDTSTGALSKLGTALVSIAILLGVLYYGGRSGLV